MQLLSTADQMQGFDSMAIGKYAIPGLILMENAGRAFVDNLARRLTSVERSSVFVFCGKGNNGGDGFVIARHLGNRGCRVRAFLIGNRRDVKGDAKTNLAIFMKMASRAKSLLRFQEITSSGQLARLPKPDVIVDAIFGTGFSGKVNGIHQHAIQWINKQGCFVASVDIPSGANASTGAVENLAVKADMTVSMGLAKVGHFVGAGREHAGEVAIADISIPSFMFQPEGRQAFRILAGDVAQVLPKRPPSAHKYSVGKVFVLGGSKSFTGAPCMCAQAAMRSGAGAVILGFPKSLHGTFARKLTEVILAPLEETAEGTISLGALDAIRERISWADTVAIGPGLSRNPETQEIVCRLVASIEKPMVIDADALTALAGHTSILKARKGTTILTPHVGELARLTQDDPTQIEMRRVEVARNAAARFKSVLVLKGSPTVTATPAGMGYLNSTGNPGMATIGSGDVLTGLIAGLLAQGMKAEEAAYSGVFIHGMAGDLAARRFGQRSMLALDILDQMAPAIRALEAT